MDEGKGAETMNEFFELFACVYANLAIYDARNGTTTTADKFVYTVCKWVNGTDPETDDPILTLALLAIENEVKKLKEN